MFKTSLHFLFYRFVNWAEGHSQLKVQQYDVPEGIFPDGLRAKVADVKVHSRGPDDVVYDNSKEIRQRVGDLITSINCHIFY